LFSYVFCQILGLKTKNSLSDAQSVEIKNLSNLLNPDDEDKLIYLASTHSYRFGNRSFFPLPDIRDISRNSLSIWLRDLIHNAYRDALLEPPIGASHPHEIRKVSTSIVWSKNASLESIMRAASWRSESTLPTFTCGTCELQGVMRLLFSTPSQSLVPLALCVWCKCSPDSLVYLKEFMEIRPLTGSRRLNYPFLFDLGLKTSSYFGKLFIDECLVSYQGKPKNF